jgi:GMP synthase (glutamine-hydrolysing)
MICVITNSPRSQQATCTRRLVEHLQTSGRRFIVLGGDESLQNVLRHSDRVSAIIISGSPLCLSKKNDLNEIRNTISVLLWFPGVPVLGICFGFQVLSLFYGGEVRSMKEQRRGRIAVELDTRSELFHGLASTCEVFVLHSDHVVQIPPRARVIARSEGLVYGIEDPHRRCYGVQFHPEALAHTHAVIDNFLAIADKKR